jgi:hypothetical protein
VLSDAKCKGAKASTKPYKLSDSGGLFLFVTPTGHKSWRLKYRVGGKEKQRVYGAYPMVGLKEARELRDEDKRLLAQGTDPAIEAARRQLSARVIAADTFEVLAREWYSDQMARWTAVHSADVLNSLERDVFPDLGRLPLETIKPPSSSLFSRKFKKEELSRPPTGFVSAFRPYSRMELRVGELRQIQRPRWAKR